MATGFLILLALLLLGLSSPGLFTVILLLLVVGIRGGL